MWMIYLDYSATTPVNKEVLDTFNKVTKDYIGNPNSLHKLGKKTKELIEVSTKQIADLLKVLPEEIIYTSGATESNNLAIKGVAVHYQNRGNHIITTKLEHASVREPIAYLTKKGFKCSYVKLTKEGLIDLKHLESLIRNDTILVSIVAVDSELGLRQPIEEIGKLLKKYPQVIFHVDATQAIGKVKVDFKNVDLISFSAHKFYGLKGIGVLIKKERIQLEPLFHGGLKNQIRSGTPSSPLIVSLAKALRLSMKDLLIKNEHIFNLNKKIKKNFSTFKGLVINNTEESIPHIINISLKNIKPETFIRGLEKHHIYISTKSACSSLKEPSLSVLELTKDQSLALSSLRISLSYLTTELEVERFLNTFVLVFDELNLKKEE